MVTVSVVIPAYNAESTLAETVNSVLAQTFTDFEVIVVNDGSRDATAAIAGSYGPRVRCISKENEGQSVARNVGIRAAEGQLIALLDHDDLWRPDKLERQVSLMETSGAGAVYTDLDVIDAHGRLGHLPRRRSNDDYCQGLLLYSTIVAGTPSSFLGIRELLLEDGGFDPRFSSCTDLDMWLRLSRRTTFAFVDAPLTIRREHGANLSKNVRQMEIETFAVLDKFYSQDYSAPYLSIRRRAYSNHWMIVSSYYINERLPREALRCACRGVLLYPPNIRQPLRQARCWIVQ
jgi:glycosyltransferase involved in cell wall biosynthesis